MIYSITMWKDVMFGCVILLWIVLFYRCIKETGIENDGIVLIHMGAIVVIYVTTGLNLQG